MWKVGNSLHVDTLKGFDNKAGYDIEYTQVKYIAQNRHYRKGTPNHHPFCHRVRCC
jgi:hypothetical protein